MKSTRRISTALWVSLLALLIAAIPLAGLHVAAPDASARWTGVFLLVVAVVTLVWALLAVQRARDDIAAARHADAKLRESEAKFSGILNIAADAIISVDEERRIVHFNWGAEQIFGYTAAEVAGQKLELLLPARFRSAHAAYVEEFGHAPEAARRMGHRREIFGVRKSGEEFPAEAAISKLRVSSNAVLYTVVLRDMTDRKRGEENQRFLASASALLGSSVDYKETLVHIAEVARPMLADACILDVVSGQAISRMVSSHDDEDAAEALLVLATRYPLTWDSPSMVVDVLRRGEPVLLATIDPDLAEARSRNDEEAAMDQRIGVKSTMILPLVSGGRVKGAITLMRTRSLQPYAAADLELAGELVQRCAFALDNALLYRTALRATDARDSVLGVVSHDLRNPISAIAMCARVLRESPPDGLAEREQLLDAITASTDWINRLIQDLLDVASIDAGHLSIERSHETAHAIVDAAVGMLAAAATERHLTVRHEVAAGTPAVYADAARVVQVLSNLIGNAVKFSPSGGEIVVHASVFGGEVMFSVGDDGPGVRPEDRAVIFERHWHARGGAAGRGTGLGLAIAKGIVDAHGGRIWVTSRPGTGSTFFFTIPVTILSDGPETLRADQAD